MLIVHKIERIIGSNFVKNTVTILMIDLLKRNDLYIKDEFKVIK